MSNIEGVPVEITELPKQDEPQKLEGDLPTKDSNMLLLPKTESRNFSHEMEDLSNEHSQLLEKSKVLDENEGRSSTKPLGNIFPMHCSI